MAKLKRGKFSVEEREVIISSHANGTSLSTLAKLLNRTEKSIQEFVGKNGPLESDIVREKDPSSIPDPPKPKPKGHSKRFFEMPDSRNPGQVRKGFSIMTQAGSEAGDEFLKGEQNDVLPMSSKHQNCIVRADSGNVIK